MIFVQRQLEIRLTVNEESLFLLQNHDWTIRYHTVMPITSADAWDS